MTIEEKKEALFAAANKAWNNCFCGWEWFDIEGHPERFLLGENEEENGFAFFIGVNDTFGGMIWIEYEPEVDMVDINIKYDPIDTKFKEDIKGLFEKYSPFQMKVSFTENGSVVLSRKEKVEPNDSLSFFKDFKAAYIEYYPLFYMFEVSSKGWFEDFYIEGCDC